MPDSLTDWTDRLANLTLPVLPDTAEELDRLAGSPVSSHTNIERILAWDPGYAIAIFRYLGNLPQAPKTPVGTLSHAISLLGSRVVRELARGLSRLEESPRSSPDQETRDCYSRACHASVYAYHWGAQRGDGNPGESGMAALVRRCGEMAMWVHFRAHMVKIRGQVTEGQNADDAARQVLGFTLDQLNQSLALRWTLPPLAVESLSTVGAFKPRPLGVMLAAALADSSGKTGLAKRPRSCWSWQQNSLDFHTIKRSRQFIAKP